MRRPEENCHVCGQSLSRFQAHKLTCYRCGEVVCRRCLTVAPKDKPNLKICRKCEGAYN